MGGTAAGDASIASEVGEIDRLVLLGASPNGPAEKLKAPTLFLVETASVREHYAAFTLSVDVAVNYAAVLRGKGNSLLRADSSRQKEQNNDGRDGTHAANLSFAAEI
jgi:hypothetical protein